MKHFRYIRAVRISRECMNYLSKQDHSTIKKFDYSIQILREQKVVHSSLVKKLIGTDFYELRITTRNEHRIILFTIDHESFVECREVLLLNGFMKKSTKEYRRAVEKARKLRTKYIGR